MKKIKIVITGEVGDNMTEDELNEILYDGIIGYIGIDNVEIQEV